MSIILAMFVMGILLGFIGAGGSGFIIAILTLLFKVPIHTALGTSLAAMAFTCLSGAYSHFKEGNSVIKTGLIVGVFGALGSYIGSNISSVIPSDSLHWLTAGMQFLSSLLLIVRLYIFKNISKSKDEINNSNNYLLGKSAILGIFCGILSGTFGIGSTPFIQIGLLTLLGLSICQSIGTTMLVILPVAFGGGVGYILEKYFDFLLLFQVLIGTMCGAYIGAKFTNFLPKVILKLAMISTPAIAGILMLIQ